MICRLILLKSQLLGLSKTKHILSMLECVYLFHFEACQIHSKSRVQISITKFLKLKPFIEQKKNNRK